MRSFEADLQPLIDGIDAESLAIGGLMRSADGQLPPTPQEIDEKSTLELLVRLGVANKAEQAANIQSQISQSETALH